MEMPKPINLHDYFTNEVQISRVENFHTYNLCYCPTKYYYWRLYTREGIEVETGKGFKDAVESGSAGHYLHQHYVYPKLIESGVRDFGWYPTTKDECTEVRFERDYLGHKIVGRIDQLLEDFDGLFLQDIKVSKGFKYIETPSFPYSMQTNVYGWGLKYPTNRFRLYMVNYFKMLQIKLIPVERDDTFIWLMKKRIEKLVEAEKINMPPKPLILQHWECKYCAFIEECYYAKNREGIHTIEKG